MKKIFLSLISISMAMTTNAQVVQVYKTANGSTAIEDSYANTSKDKYEAVMTRQAKTIQSITVNGAKYAKAGTSTNYTTSITTSNGTTASVKWSSNNTEVAIVDESTGEVCVNGGVKVGSAATITATITTSDGSILKVDNPIVVTTSVPVLQTMYDMIHPVNELVIGFAQPVVPIGVTATWEVQNDYDGKALWVDSSVEPGTNYDGSLPNITGTLYANVKASSVSTSGTGAFQNNTIKTSMDSRQEYTGSIINQIKIDASDSNSIYAASAGENIVRPTSVTIKVYKRTE